MDNIINRPPTKFNCVHCGCTSEIITIWRADFGVRGRYESGVEEFKKYAGRQDPDCMLKARVAKKIMDGNDYDLYITCPICFNRTKFRFGEG